MFVDLFMRNRFKHSNTATSNMKPDRNVSITLLHPEQQMQNGKYTELHI